MLACVDVSYGEIDAVSGCILFPEWTSDRGSETLLVSTPIAAPYRPGEFYLRELPPLIAVLARVMVPLEAILVDGYAWLGHEHPGLGARLFDALRGKTPIIGIAKTKWAGDASASWANDDSHRAIAVVRGLSIKPLHVTAVGTDVAVAAANVQRMHGANRLPTLLKAVDRLVRDAAMVAFVKS